MANKRLIIVVVLLLVVQKGFAIGFQIEIGGGYGFAAARDEDVPSYTVDSDTNISYWKDELVSRGNGVKIDIGTTLFMNDYWGIMLSTGLSLSGGYDVEQKLLLDSTFFTLKANYFPLFLGIKIKGGNKRIIPYVYMAPGIIIPFNITGEAVYHAEGQKYITDATEKFNVGFGISSGLGAQLNINKVIGVKCEFAPTYATARLYEIILKYDVNDTLFTEKIRFKRDTAELPPDEFGDDYAIYYYHGAPFWSFSSIAAKIGIIFRF